MNGRDRILATVARNGPYRGDRVALGDMGFGDRVMSGLAQQLGVEGALGVRRALGIDLVGLNAPYVGPNFAYKPESQRQQFFASSHKSYSEVVIERPLRHAKTVRDVEAFRWPTVDDYDFSGMPAAAEDLDGLAIASPGWTPTFSQLCELFGLETALTNLVDRPAVVQACVGHITELVCGLARRMRETVGDRLLIFKTSDDIATHQALFFSPDAWRRCFKRALTEQFALGKQLGCINMLHACGAVRAIIPDLIDIGLDILEPSQFHLPGMDPTELKREFGRHLTFFGGICTQRTLPFGTPEDIRREVRDRVQVLNEGGGYICSPDHTVLDDVPVDNVLALYDEVKQL